MNTLFIQSITNLEDAIKDYKLGLMTEDLFQSKIRSIAHDITIDEEMDMREADEIANTGIHIICSKCKKEWLAGDKDRTPEEKKNWICPVCIEEMKQIEEEHSREEASPEYPLGGMAEPCDIGKEDDLCH